MKIVLSFVILVTVVGLFSTEKVSRWAADSSDQDSLNVVLTDLKQKPRVEKPLSFDMHLVNVREHPIPVAAIDNVLLSVIGPDGEPLRYLDDVIEYEDVAVEDWQGEVLEPGTMSPVERYGPLQFTKPGEYTLWVTYHGPGFPGGVESNRITFTIE